MGMVFEIVTFAASIVTVLGLVTIVYLGLSWLTAPRFVVGILPDAAELQSKRLSVGEPSHFDEILFDRRVLARQISGESKLNKCIDFQSSREIQGKDGVVKLPIVVQNCGRRDASSYLIGIGYPNDIHLIDVKTETLKIDGLFVSNEENIQDRQLIAYVPALDIRKVYNQLGLTRDFVSFRGALGSHTFEMVHLRLKVPENRNQFFVVFRIDCPQALLRRATYAQSVHVGHSERHGAKKK